MKQELLKKVEGLLVENLTLRVKALVLQILIKGDFQNPSSETVMQITKRSLFSTFSIYRAEKIICELDKFYGAISSENEKEDEEESK